MELPDHSMLCRYRQWLMKGDLLKRLMAEINGQLEQQNLKISNANVAVVDASIIESIGAPKRKAMDVEENGDVTPKPASKDKEAKWVKKAGRPITANEQRHNNEIKTKRWVIELRWILYAA